MAEDLADQAYGHCLAVLGDPEAAADAAVVALRRAGRSRLSVLAHARHQALERAEGVSGPAPETPVPADVAQLARLLALTRPPVERALVDLRGRLDRGGLGRALGMAAGDAAARSDAACEVWDRELDPLLLASLGPGDCPDLAAVLAEAPPPTTLGELTAAGPAVAGHVAGCEVCGDRLRAMVTVRGLQSQGPTDVPDAVRESSRRSRRMRPGAGPPPLEPGRRLPPVLVVAGVALAVVLIAGGAALGISRMHHGDQAGRVARLTRLPVGGGVLSIAADGNVVRVTDRAGHAVHWQATSDAPWLVIRPSSGRLDPGGVAELAVRVAPSSPEGPVRATVTVSADDGSAAATTYATTVERPPDVAASVDACTVSATADDESGITGVDLHWSAAGAEHATSMTPTPQGFTAELPESTPLTWWVQARDSRGNTAKTAAATATC
jgi:BACON domain-containing protein